MTFGQIAEMVGESIREACFDPSGDVFALLRKYPRCKACYKMTHLLKLLEGAYRRKDANSLWKMKFKEALFKPSCRQSMNDQ